MAINLILPGNPRPAPRPRVSNGHAHNPSWYTTLKTGWALAARSQMNAADWEPVIGRLDVHAVFYRENHVKADADNLLKTALDALNGIAFADDAQVDRLSASVVRGVGKAQARAVVSVRVVEDSSFVMPSRGCWFGA